MTKRMFNPLDLDLRNHKRATVSSCTAESMMAGRLNKRVTREMAASVDMAMTGNGKLRTDSGKKVVDRCYSLPVEEKLKVIEKRGRFSRDSSIFGRALPFLSMQGKRNAHLIVVKARPNLYGGMSAVWSERRGKRT